MKDKTVLIIVLRMRTVKNADQAVALDHGTAAEIGAPAELMKQKTPSPGWCSSRPRARPGLWDKEESYRDRQRLSATPYQRKHVGTADRPFLHFRSQSSALCQNGEGIRYHAPCLANLPTGEVGVLAVYAQHPPRLVGEIVPEEKQ